MLTFLLVTSSSLPSFLYFSPRFLNLSRQQYSTIIMISTPYHPKFQLEHKLRITHALSIFGSDKTNTPRIFPQLKFEKVSISKNTFHFITILNGLQKKKKRREDTASPKDFEQRKRRKYKPKKIIRH